MEMEMMNKTILKATYKLQPYEASGMAMISWSQPCRRWVFHNCNYNCKSIPLCYFSSSNENSELEILIEGKRQIKVCGST